MNEYEIWYLKKNVLYGILSSISNLLKESEKGSFDVHYWVLKTHGNIALAFKDMKEAADAFTRCKHVCDLKIKLTHKMICYKQLGYIRRL